MKLIPTFNSNALLLIGHGFFPWLFSIKFEFKKELIQTKKKFGTTVVTHLDKEQAHLYYDGLKLTVMGYKVSAQAILAHQLHQWINNWKNDD